jgi:hypothetical protein
MCPQLLRVLMLLLCVLILLCVLMCPHPAMYVLTCHDGALCVLLYPHADICVRMVLYCAALNMIYLLRHTEHKSNNSLIGLNVVVCLWKPHSTRVSAGLIEVVCLQAS